MKRIEFLVLHLGFGGIEKAVSSVANGFKDVAEVSIVSLYRLYPEPVFPIDSNIKIRYLYDTDVPLRVKKYHQCFKEKKIGKLFRAVFEDYWKGFHFFHFFHDLFVSIDIYFLKGRFRKLKKYLKKADADIFISTRWEISQYLSKYGKKESFKIGWEHNHPHGNINYQNQVVKASKDLNMLVLVSKMLTLHYQKLLSNETCQCVYIPNFLDYDLPFISDYQNKQILMVGRLEQEKGLFDALKVIKRLQEMGVFYHLDIVGDGPLKKDLMQQISALNLTEHVTLHGFQDHKYIENLYRHASIYLMTSYTESFGLVLLEAMNAGLLCLAFDEAEGALELIQNDYNGYLISNRNILEMAEMIHYLSNHPEKVRKLGANAKDSSKSFLPQSVMEGWYAICNVKR